MNENEFSKQDKTKVTDEQKWINSDRKCDKNEYKNWSYVRTKENGRKLKIEQIKNKNRMHEW